VARGARPRRLLPAAWLVCPLANPERTPVGIPCYCILPDRRYIAGTTSPLFYRGQVNPYLNPHPPAVPSVIK
jgi:hypothetical protein